MMSTELDFYAMMIQPMRDDLTGIGFTELKSAAEVNEKLGEKTGTTLLVVNSICGCAGGIARPGIAMSLENSAKPDRLVTVFAGQDKEATAKAREYLVGQPPSSPSVWLFKDGNLVAMLHRHDIEGTSAEHVANRLKEFYNQYCA